MFIEIFNPRYVPLLTSSRRPVRPASAAICPLAVPLSARPSPRAARFRSCWHGAFGVLALCAACGVAAQGSNAAQVEVVLDGETYSVRASAQLAANQRVVWDTLTDYEHLREFVPGVTRARVVARDGNQLTIEQVGVFPLFVVDLPVRVRLNVQHAPYTMVLARMAPNPVDWGEPTVRSFIGRYTLSTIRLAQRAGVRLDYDAQFELARPLPPLIGPLFGVVLIRRTMRTQFEGMLREIERRQAVLAAIERAG